MDLALVEYLRVLELEKRGIGHHETSHRTAGRQTLTGCNSKASTISGFVHKIWGEKIQFYKKNRILGKYSRPKVQQGRYQILQSGEKKCIL